MDLFLDDIFSDIDQKNFNFLCILQGVVTLKSEPICLQIFQAIIRKLKELVRVGLNALSVWSHVTWLWGCIKTVCWII